jgi:putative Mn2+ efflux pump MntP
MATVVLLGFVLGIDSFRASLGLGVARGKFGGRARLALAFGLCDGVAPLLGLALGSALVTSISPWCGRLGPLILGGFGLFTFVTAGRAEGDEAEPAGTWVCFGLPLSLSLDNLVAGLGLGTIRMPVLLSAAIIGLISGLMSLVGWNAGRWVGRAIPARAERLGGAGIALLAVAMGLEIV